ncbi:MAG: MBL fold metallo-hydrolase [Bdellovibrionota bacterium]
MKCSVLSSGSKANATYIETHDASILIDCGLSCRQCEKALNNISVNPASIDAIFITHAHSDHIKGVKLFSNRHKVPVYATKETLCVLDDPFEPIVIEKSRSYELKSFLISTASTSHDAENSLSFKVSDSLHTIGYLTDTGKVSKKLEKFLQNLSLLILEFNHDPIMLQTCDYPWHLKERIASSYGHLSNLEASEFFKKVYHENLKALFLAHISENTNTKEHAFKEATRTLSKIDESSNCFIKALGYDATPLYDLEKDFETLEIKEDYKLAVCL